VKVKKNLKVSKNVRKELLNLFLKISQFVSDATIQGVHEK